MWAESKEFRPLGLYCTFARLTGNSGPAVQVEGKQYGGA